MTDMLLARALRSSMIPVVACLLATGLAACEGFKEAMTAHVDVAARAGNQELSVPRLATLVGRSRAPLQREFVRQLAQVWVDYQLLGHAAAVGDSLNRPDVEENALWAVMANAKAKQWFEILSKQWVGADSLHYPQDYAGGDAIAAKHILLAPKAGDTSAAALDSLRKKAVALRAQVTPANFSDMAKKNSQDPGSATRGGDLGVFTKGQMVPQFEQAVLLLKPGEISQPIKTQFGYHIIYRPTYDEAKENFAKAMRQRTLQKAESAYFVRLDSASKVRLTSNAVTTTRAVARDIDGHRNDKTPIATTAMGEFTAGRLAKWLSIFPPQIRTQLPTAPDTTIEGFVKNVTRNEMILREADSAHVTLDTAETNGIRKTYGQLITNAWSQLGVDPKMLADSAKAPGDRERLAAAHIETFLDKLLLAPTPTVRYVDVPQPLDAALRGEYRSDLNETGLDRALASATTIRRTADSVRTAQEPPSAVPLPGGASPAGGNAPAPGSPGSPGSPASPGSPGSGGATKKP